MIVALHGSYSIVVEDTTSVIKLIRPQPDPPSVIQRYADVITYYTYLQKAGIHVPQTSVGVLGEYLIIVMDRVTGENAFTALLRRGKAQQTPDLSTIFTTCCTQVIQLMKGLHGHFPVGYDASPENFIVSPDLQEASCIDIYPPRLGFFIDENGQAQRFAEQGLLVDYPGHGRASSDRWPALRYAYYTPVGMMKHFLVWCAASGVATSAAPSLDQAQSLFHTFKAIALTHLEAAQLHSDAATLDSACTELWIMEILPYRLNRIKERLQEGS